MIRRLIEQTFGVEPIVLTSTSSPIALTFTVAGRQYVAKTAAPNHPGAALVEAWAYQTCRRHGIRTPEVVAISTAPECIIIEMLPGQSLWSDTRNAAFDRAIWTQVGADLRSMHEIRLTGFGPLTMITNDTPRGESDRWCPWVRYAREQGIAHLASAGYISPQAAHDLERRFDDAADALNTWADGRLLHGDLEGGHVFGSHTGDYSGIIDFGMAQSGDPRWDLARICLWDGQAALAAVLDGYGHDTLNRDDRTTVLPLYLWAFVIHQAVHFDRNGQRDTVVGHLQQMEHLH